MDVDGASEHHDITYDPALCNLVIVDDWLKAPKDQLHVLTDFYTRSRKYGVFLVFLSQRYYSTDTYFRDNTWYSVFLGDINDKVMRRICAELASRLADADEVCRMYGEAVQHWPNFFMVDRNEKVDKRLKYRKSLELPPA